MASSATFILPNQFSGTTFSAAETFSPSIRVNFRQHPRRRVSAFYATTVDERSSANQISYRASLYEVLGIPMGATGKEIKTAYRRLARVLHPDVASNNGREGMSAGGAAAGNDFIKVHKAYVTLSDPTTRADYDRTLFRQRRSSVSVLSSATKSSSGYTRRTWETDQCW